MPDREAIQDIKYAENLPQWIKLHQLLGWTDLQVTITEAGAFRLSGVRFHTPLKTKKPLSRAK